MQEKHPTCEALTARGMCGAPLDEHGQCPRATAHIEDEFTDAETRMRLRISRALADYESELMSQRISAGRRVRRVGGGAALLVLAVAALTACGGGDSSAPTASCVSSAQAAKLHQGMTRPEVQKLFGSPGEQYASGHGWENRGWDSCEDKSHELGVLFVQKGDQWAVKCESGCTL